MTSSQAPRGGSLLRWTLADLTFALSRQKLVVARRNRPELAHLTIGWGNVSREIDVHVTWDHEAAMSGGTKRHERLLVITEETLQRSAQIAQAFTDGAMRAFIRESFTRYRPGWLARRGYVVAVATVGQASELIRQVAPRRRGKHRIDLREMTNPTRVGAVLGDSIYPPDILAALNRTDIVAALRVQMPVTALRIDPTGVLVKRDTISLHHGLGWDGTVGWNGIMHRHASTFATQTIRPLIDGIAARATEAVRRALDEVVAGMALEEIPDVQRVIDRTGRAGPPA